MPFSLVGTLGLDTSPYESALNKMERASLESATRLQQGLKQDSMNPFLAYNKRATDAGKQAGTNFGHSFTEAVKGFLEGGPTGLLNAIKGSGLSSLLGGAARASLIAAPFVVGNKLANDAVGERTDITQNAARLNVSREDAQRIEKVFGESAAHAFDHLAKSQVELREGGPESDKLLNAFAKLGVGASAAQGSSPMAIMQMLSDNLKGDVSQEQIAALKDIFGKGGVELLPGLKKGMDTDKAAAGNYSEDDLKVLDDLKKHEERTGNFFSEYFTAAKMASARVKRFLTVSQSELDVNRLRKHDADEESQARRELALEQAKAEMEKRAEDKKAAVEKERSEKVIAKNGAAAAALDQRNSAMKEDLDLADMTPAQRKAHLEAEKKRLEGERDALSAEQFTIPLGDREKASDFDLRSEQNRAALLQNRKALGSVKDLGVGFESRMDSLNKIGGGTGAADMGFRQDFAKALGILEAIKGNTGRQFGDGL
jgi:hypothetical protein